MVPPTRLPARLPVRLLASPPPRPPPKQSVTLERPLPHPIWRKGNTVELFEPPPRWLSEVGVEGLTFAFKHEKYRGHHLVSWVLRFVHVAFACCNPLLLSSTAAWQPCRAVLTNLPGHLSCYPANMQTCAPRPPALPTGEGLERN